MSLRTLPLTLRQLQYVVAVADARGFRQAAERCHVSQPSLSAQVGELEGALGVKLFERARRVLLEADDLLEVAKRHVDPLAGTLRLGVVPTVGPYLLPEIDPALRRAFPRLTEPVSIGPRYVTPRHGKKSAG
jgi:LysR family transcriptional regulator, hydrogen peroxide-inducible genes activator